MLSTKKAIKTCFIFSPHLPRASVLLGEQRHKNCIFSFKCCIIPLPNYMVKSDNGVVGLIYSVLLLATHAHADV